MAKTFRLAGERLQSKGSGGISPILFDSGAVGDFRAPIIDPRAANTRFTPAPIPETVIDTTGDSAAAFADAMANAAFKLQEQEAQAQADTAVLNLQGQFQEKFRQYETLLGQGAAEGYQAYAAAVDASGAEALESLSPSARAKAVNRTHQLRNSTLNQGATHKNKQFRVWQGNILQAQEDTVVNMAAKAYSDPAAIKQMSDAQMASIAQYNAGRPDFISVKQQEFKDKMFGAVINTSIANDAYDIANNYIEGGKAEGVNSNMLAASFLKLEAAIDSSVTKDFRDDARNLAIQKRNDEANAKTYGSLALKTGDDSVLAGILDLDLRAKMANTIDTIRSKTVTTIPAARDAMIARRTELTSNPKLLLSPEVFPNVSSEHRLAFYNQVITDRKTGVTSLRKSNDDWIDSFMPPSIQGGMAMRSQKPGDIAMRASLTNILDDSIDQAILKGESPETAVFNAKAKIIASPNFKTDFANLKINRQHLIRVEGVNNLQDIESTLLSTSDPIAQREMLQSNYGQAARGVLTKYGVPNDIFKKNGASFMDAIGHLAGDTAALRSFMRDASSLMLQNRYYTNELERSISSNNNTSLTPSNIGN